MPGLSPSQSAPVSVSLPIRPSAVRTRSTSSPRLLPHRVFSAGHIDDLSTYHGENHDAKHHHESEGDPSLEYSKRRLQEDDEEARNAGLSEVESVEMGIRTTRDIESGLEKKQSSDEEKARKDPNLVSWDGPEDPENPKNWTKKRKWAATLVVSSFTFISPVSSSMVAPALGTIAKEFGITNDVETQVVLSIFVLGYAIGPLVLGPLSEIYGRVPVLQLANLFYLVFNLGCGFSRNKGELIAFRFLSGIGGSAPLSCGGGVLSDCWRADERGRAISVYSLAPLLGPAIGPIAGGFITENTTWRWAFYATSIADAAVQISGLIFLRETYPPKLLHLKAEKLRKETGNDQLHTEFEHPERSFIATMERSLVRPFRLLFTQLIVQVLSVYMAFIYGLMYLLLASFPVLWSKQYNESIGIGGLNYISLGLGFFLGTQICAPLNDAIYRRLRARSASKTGRPEFRVPLMIPASLLSPIGLFLYGWSAAYTVHWIVPNIGVAIFAISTIVSFQAIQVYLVDAYVQYAASAMAAVTVLRSLAGFGFPLFAPVMFNHLGYGWGNSVLGFVGVGLGVPAPFMLWKWGERLRKKSRYAAGGGE